MRIPGGKAVQRLISQAYVELIFPLATHYFTVNPLIKQMDEIGKAYLRKQVHDPRVRDALTPRYAVGCKRPGFHNTYLSTFTARTSGWSPNLSTRSPVRVWPPPTANLTTSTS
jgi:cation diffusion facilitator CzcD-associated flavoprotein CzcO